MKNFLLALALLPLLARAEPVPLFDGKTFDGWEGDTQKTWRIVEGAFVGGSLAEKVPRNEFLATKRSFQNFDLRLKFKLLGSEGFVNSGVQIRSVRIAKPAHEMSGYQADIGDPEWWGALYDESRRNKVLAKSDMAAVGPTLKRGDWNEYRIRAEGARIQLWINGVPSVDYTEPDGAIAQDGHIAVQVHGGGKAEAWFKDITIEELPPTPDAPKWPAETKPNAELQKRGARDISYNAVESGARPAEAERASFKLPEGFVAELVADESVMAKAVAFNFDTAGRMWVTTASEYPLDGNEQPEAAAELYKKGGKDAVLVFDTPWAEGVQKPRTWADKLAMPMGVLPYKDGALVQHGPEILFLRDTDGDGRAEKKEVLLSGFGIQDSHLMPHGFTRGPGDWIYFAQGAFNTSHVLTKEGQVVEAKHCKLMRMKPDGSRFEIVGWGLNNIWGFAIDPRGEMWVQEANDLGYPVAPFQVGMAFPGIGSDKPRPYAPFMPPPAKVGDCTMGGTGLSGLALNEDASTWPAPWTGAFMIANPITNKLQAVRVHRESPGYDGVKLEKLPDFLVSDDQWFRPVAIQFGPDGALYVIDWYNKIISHNEVPRAHPDRDKQRSRIWRIRWTGAAKREVPNLQKEKPEQLVARLGSADQWEANAARFEIIDRGFAQPLEESLRALVRDRKAATRSRLQAGWALAPLRGQGSDLGFDIPIMLFNEASPELRRAGVEQFNYSAHELAESGRGLWHDPASSVQVALLRRLAGHLWRDGNPDSLAALALIEIGRTARARASTSADSAFAASVARLVLEGESGRIAALLNNPELAAKVPLEDRAFATLVLEPQAGSALLAGFLPELNRPLFPDELALLAAQISQPVVVAAFSKVLSEPNQQAAALGAIEKLPATALAPAGQDAHAHSGGLAPGSMQPAKPKPKGADEKKPAVGANEVHALIAGAARDLLMREPSEANRRLVVRLAKAHRIAALEPEVVSVVTSDAVKAADRIEGVKALREMGADRVELFHRLATRKSGDAKQTEELRREAVTALTGADGEDVVPRLAQLWPDLGPSLRKIALDRVASSKVQAPRLVAAAKTNTFPLEDLDGDALDKLTAVLGPNDPALVALLGEMKGAMQPVLRLDGTPGAFVETKIDLVGAFTVETWIKLDDDITNADGILGRPGGPDINFYHRTLRLYGGPVAKDVIVATRPMLANVWTHVAITRDAAGALALYLDGQPASDKFTPFPEPMTGLDLGRPNVTTGCGASITELRIWNVARTSDEIRDSYQRSFGGEPLPPGLVRCLSGSGPWGKLAGAARVQPTRDFPELLTPKAARELDEKFASIRQLAEAPGNADRGSILLGALCQVCHVVRGHGNIIGPDLSGAGAMGTEALLRNILTPHAQLESGYYRHDVALKSGDVISGFLVKEDATAITLRPLGADDRTISRSDIKKLTVTKKSLMPEGLLDGLPPQDVSDLFAYLKTLK